jgi:hypothetical protein
MMKKINRLYKTYQNSKRFFYGNLEGVNLVLNAFIVFSVCSLHFFVDFFATDKLKTAPEPSWYEQETNSRKGLHQVCT